MIKNHVWCDVIHVFGNVNITSAAISYAKFTKKPILIELVNLVDNPHHYEPLFISMIAGKGFPKNALLVCISQQLRKVCLAHGYEDSQIWCRPNPVDENRFNYKKEMKYRVRKKITPFGDTDKVILHLAKFIPRKKQNFITGVMPLLPDNFKLILAGPLVDSGPLLKRDTDYFNSIKSSIRSLNIETKVHIVTDFIENPEEFIQASDVFVLPSIREGLGTTVLEALACGVPVVTNDIPGVFDQWIENGVNGFICPLIHEKWADRIQRAALICEKIMKNSSEIIMNQASTEMIDQGYYKRLTKLIH